MSGLRSRPRDPSNSRPKLATGLEIDTSEPLSTPVSKDGSKDSGRGGTASARSKALERLRQHRQQSGEVGGDGKPMERDRDATMKRLEALRQKQRSSKKMKDSGKGGDDTQSLLKEEDDESGQLVHIQQPMHIFPQHVLCTGRWSENSLQPQLHTPYAHPSCTRICTSCSTLRSSPSPHNLPPRREGTWEIESYGDVTDWRGRDEGLPEESEHLLGRNSQNSSRLTQIPNVFVEEEVRSPIRREEGLYTGTSNIMAQLLLRSENVDLPIATFVSSNVYLSRATQRLLRDAYSSRSSHLLRQIHAQVQLGRDASSLIDSFNQLQTKDGKKGHEQWQTLLTTSCRMKGQIPGISVLLKASEREPTLRLLENFVDQRTMQQVHPSTVKRGVFSEGENALILRPDSRDSAGAVFDTEHSKGYQEKKGVTLKILAQELCLTDHPYMSSEEALYVKLKRYYVQYARLFQGHAMEYLPYRLLALLSELSDFVNPLSVVDIPQSEASSIVQKLYTDILETLPALCEFKTAVEASGKDVYKTWRDLVDTRKQQHFVSTRAVLRAHRLETTSESDVTSDKSPRHIPNISRWNELRGKLGDLRRILDDAYRYFAPDVESTEAPTSSAQQSIKRSNSKAQATEVPNKHKEQHLRALKLVDDAVEYLTENDTILPDVIYKLHNSGTISPDTQVDVAEIERRRKLRRVRVRLVLRVNGQVLGTTTPQPLQWPALKVEVGRLFELRVLREPTEAVFNVYTSYELRHTSLACCAGIISNETLVATIGVPLSQRQTQNSKRSGKECAVPALCYAPVIGWYDFTSPRIVASKGRGVDSQGNRKKVSSVRVEGALLCGSEYDVGFDAHENSVVVGNSYDGVHGNDFAYIPTHAVGEWKSQGRGRIVGGSLEFTREKDFFELLPPLKLIDVNDPRNDTVVQHQIRGILSGRLKKRDIFQLGGEFFSSLHGENGVSYGQFLHLQLSNRHKLLQLREIKPYLFTEGIPLSEEAIKQSELFRTMLAKEIRKGLDPNMPHYLQLAEPESGTETEGEAEGRATMKATTFLNRVRDSQIVLSRRARKKKVVTSSVVHEVLAPLNEWSVLEFFKVFSIPERKRALKPRAVERVPEALPRHCELLVQVVSARNVPLRASSTQEVESGRNRTSRRTFGGRAASEFDDDDPGAATSLLHADSDSHFLRERKRVRTFVEVSFQSRTARTSTVDGPCPMWKQTLALPFHPPHGEFNHANLEQVEDEVYFTLFDEVENDDAARGGFLEGESTIREEKRYLGSFSIPFSTILSEKRIEGTFRLNTPPFNYGYTTSRHEPSTVQEEPQESGGILSMLGFGVARPFRRKENTDTDQLDPATMKELDWFCCGPFNATYITIMTTLDPLLTSSPYTDCDISAATVYPPDRPMVAYTQFWLNSLKEIGSHTKNRKYTIYGSNSDGLSVLICRYLKPLRPPPGVTTRRGCIHIVSLIPFIPDSQAFVGEFDLWCTTSQMFEIMGGDEEEHATALYNFLYYLSTANYSGNVDTAGRKGKGDDPKSRPYPGYPSLEFVRNEELFLVIGNAVPEGETVYVMIRRAGREPSTSSNAAESTSASAYLLVNPCTGHVYSAADVNCPLSEIYCLVTPYNIWANIQKASKPKDLCYDILRPSLWRPLFGHRFHPPVTSLSSIQREIAYTPTAPGPCLEIEKLLKNDIKASMRKWRSKRPRSVTAFHPDACAVMTDLLTSLEEWKLNGTIDGRNVAAVSSSGALGNTRLSSSGGVPSNVLMAIEERATHRLKGVLRTHRLTGYPINIPYTDVESVVEKVRSASIHENKHPEVQFVLAVRAFPHFNGLISLWVFLGALEKE